MISFCMPRPRETLRRLGGWWGWERTRIMSTTVFVALQSTFLLIGLLMCFRFLASIRSYSFAATVIPNHGNGGIPVTGINLSLEAAPGAVCVTFCK
jgi:hypothetical protein